MMITLAVYHRPMIQLARERAMLMTWYIPLVSALLGAGLGFVGSFFVTRTQFERQVAHDRRMLSSSLCIEIESIINFFNVCLTNASPDTIAEMPPKKEIESACGIYRSNCGRIGILSDGVALSVVKFYAGVLTVAPFDRDHAVDRYRVEELQKLIELGKIAVADIKREG